MAEAHRRGGAEVRRTILEPDRRAPREERHTAHRIWQRIRRERPECEIRVDSAALHEGAAPGRRVNAYEAVADPGEGWQVWQYSA